MDPVHPECPERLDKIIEGVNAAKSSYPNNIEIRDAIPIEEKALYYVHVPDLVHTIKSISEAGGGMITLDTMLNEETFNSALYAAGGAKQAVFEAYNRHTKTFAVVRPPGHHASNNTAGGFCFFNNIAIATTLLLRQTSAERVAIVDLDHHYGNGTAQIFYHRSDVLYTSIHCHPKYSYPFSGYPEEIGVREGKGYNINVPLLPKTETMDWLYSLKFLMEIIRQYEPNVILVSIGFDGLKKDPVGMLSLSLEAFQAASYMLSKLADEVCEGRMASVLEGGYYLELLPRCSEQYVRGMLLGDKPVLLKKLESYEPTSYTQAILNQTKKAIKGKWKN